MNKQQLTENIKRKQSFLCVGLDTDIKKIPEHLLKEEDPIFAFNKAIIDATAPYCIAYKPNLAFYSFRKDRGIHQEELSRPIHHRRRQARRHREHLGDVRTYLLRRTRYRLGNRSSLHGRG